MTVVLNEQRQKVFLDRYAKKDENGKVVEKTVEDMWTRVANAIGNNEKEWDSFRNILYDFKFVPGGRILAGAGIGNEQTFYNCYVIPVEPKESTRKDKPIVGNDSREAIFDTMATMVDIMSRGGGVGINWSTLRPKSSYLYRVGGSSSGPVGWMDVASKAVGEVEQGGSRRGAAMFMLNDWHPDILEFIEAKRDYSKITNANVSVAISDAFMEAVKNDAGWQLEFPNTNEPGYNTEWDGDLAGWKAKGYGVSISRSVPARRVWDAIIQSAHASGEPGVVFLGRYNKLSTASSIERIISVNPCGEQGLGAYSVCNLGSMNLAAYVEIGTFLEWEFEEDVATAVRFLDNVIDKSFYWDERSKTAQKKLRRIGLGVMGLADVLIKLGIRYGSKEAVEFTEKVFKIMKNTAIETSLNLAIEKGPAEGYNESMWNRPYLNSWVKDLANYEYGLQPLRNLFFLTQAPTGTTSILAGVNSGIEPYFAFSYTRTDRTGTHKVVADIVNNFDDSSRDDALVTANDISVEEHIAMQAAVQKYVDSSVSKTINGPESHTIVDVEKAYRLAYDSGLKGLAYFRNNSGRAQVLTVEAPVSVDLSPKLEEAHKKIALLEDQLLVGPKASEYRRPAVMSGTTSRLNTSMGTMYLTINKDEDSRPVEVFVNVGKAGSDVMAMGEAVGRLVSLGLQKGIALSTISAQLVGVGGTSSFNPGLVHAIGKALESMQNTFEYTFEYKIDGGMVKESVFDVSSVGSSFDICPECGSASFVREEGCQKCQSCGFSKC